MQMEFSKLTLVSVAFLLMILIAYILWKYSILMKSVLRYIFLVYIVFFLSLYGVMVLPLDISSTAYSMCLESQNTTKLTCIKPPNFVSHEVLVIIWRTIYWILVAFAWVILPYAKCIAISGHFKFIKKLRFAFIYNMAFDITYLILFICFLCYMRFKPDPIEITFHSIKGLGAATANTAGIFLLILVMGYGFVDFPRYLWKSSEYRFQYNKTLFNIASAAETLFIYNRKLEKNVRQVAIALRSVDEYSEASKCVKTILSKLPLEQQNKIINDQVDISGSRDSIDYTISFKSYIFDFFGIHNDESTTAADYNSMKDLVSLHTDVKHNVLTLQTTTFHFNELLRSAIFYEDIRNNVRHPSYSLILTIPQRYSRYTEFWLPFLEKLWYIRLRKITLRVLSIITAIFSFIIVFSEITMSKTTPVISILALTMKRLLEPHVYYLIPQIFSFLTLSYMAICTYRTVFRLKLFDVIKIMSNHQTNIYSLLHSGTIVGFFFAPICLNYLCLIHLDKGTLFNLNQSKVETAFSKIEGRLVLLPFISEYFNIYYPIIMVAICIFAALSLATRFLNTFGCGYYSINNEYSDEQISEGLIILQRERNRIIDELIKEDPSLFIPDRNPLITPESEREYLD